MQREANPTADVLPKDIREAMEGMESMSVEDSIKKLCAAVKMNVVILRNMSQRPEATITPLSQRDKNAVAKIAFALATKSGARDVFEERYKLLRNEVDDWMRHVGLLSNEITESTPSLQENEKEDPEDTLPSLERHVLTLVEHAYAEKRLRQDDLEPRRNTDDPPTHLLITPISRRKIAQFVHELRTVPGARELFEHMYKLPHETIKNWLQEADLPYVDDHQATPISNTDSHTVVTVRIDAAHEETVHESRNGHGNTHTATWSASDLQQTGTHEDMSDGDSSNSGHINLETEKLTEVMNPVDTVIANACAALDMETVPFDIRMTGEIVVPVERFNPKMRQATINILNQLSTDEREEFSKNYRLSLEDIALLMGTSSAQEPSSDNGKQIVDALVHGDNPDEQHNIIDGSPAPENTSEAVATERPFHTIIESIQGMDVMAATASVAAQLEVPARVLQQMKEMEAPVSLLKIALQYRVKISEMCYILSFIPDGRTYFEQTHNLSSTRMTKSMEQKNLPFVQSETALKNHDSHRNNGNGHVHRFEATDPDHLTEQHQQMIHTLLTELCIEHGVSPSLFEQRIAGEAPLLGECPTDMQRLVMIIVERIRNVKGLLSHFASTYHFPEVTVQALSLRETVAKKTNGVLQKRQSMQTQIKEILETVPVPSAFTPAQHIKHALSNETFEIPHADILQKVGMILDGDPKMIQMWKRVCKYAANPDINILIRGESGSGKELVPQAIHQLGFADKKFVIINCGAFNPQLIESAFFGHEKGSFTGADRQHIGAFEEAKDGLIVLDEIGDLDQNLQVKLLRAIENKKIRRVGGNQDITIGNIKIIATTNKKIPTMVEMGTFRHDLYLRIAGADIHLPPLRDRAIEHKVELVSHFLRTISTEKKTSLTAYEDAVQCMAAVKYIGNVREMKALIMKVYEEARSRNANAPNIELQDVIEAGQSSPSSANFEESQQDNEATHGKKKFYFNGAFSVHKNSADPDEAHITIDTTLIQGDPADPKKSGRLGDMVASFEKIAVFEALKQKEGNQSAAAALLGITRGKVRQIIANESPHDVGPTMREYLGEMKFTLD